MKSRIVRARCSGGGSAWVTGFVIDCCKRAKAGRQSSDGLQISKDVTSTHHCRNAARPLDGRNHA